GPEYRSTGVAAFPSQPPTAQKPERGVISSDHSFAAVQGKLQAAAEKAIHTAINSQLNDAVKQALSKVDEVCKTSIGQIEQHSEQRLETMMRTAREEVMSRMESRLAEDRTRWEQTHEEFRGRTAELSERLERLA